VLVGGGKRDTSARSARDESLLNEERFVHVLDRFGLLADRDRKRRETNGTTPELAAQRGEHRAIDLVETTFVDTEHGQCLDGGRLVDDTLAVNLGEVAHTTQQSVRDAWRSAAATRDLNRAGLVGGDAENRSGAHDDCAPFVFVVEVETTDETESITKPSGDQSRSPGCTNEH